MPSWPHLGVAAWGYERIWKDTKGYEGYVRISLEDLDMSFETYPSKISISFIQTYPVISVISTRILYLYLYTYPSCYPINISRHISFISWDILLIYPCTYPWHRSKFIIQLHIFCILCYPFRLSLHILLVIHAHIQSSYPNYISFLSGCILPIYPCISYLVIQTFIQ